MPVMGYEDAATIAANPRTVRAACECGWSRHVPIPVDCDPTDPADRNDVRIGAIQRHRVEQGGVGTVRCRRA